MVLRPPPAVAQAPPRAPRTVSAELKAGVLAADLATARHRRPARTTPTRAATHKAVEAVAAAAR